MAVFEEYQASISSANYISEINNEIGPLSRNPQTRGLAGRLFADLTSRDLSALRGSPNEWFNLATSAGQCRNTTAEHKILQTAITLHPQDVDLLCAWFQLMYIHGTMADAIAACQRIEDLGEDATAPSWRYWVFNATFLARYLNDKARAVEVLDRALTKVAPADLLNIFRQYRLVLIDGVSRPSASQDSSLTDHAALLSRVEEKYRQGLDLGIEGGYVLAVDLARLLRERSTGNQDNADAILDDVIKLLDIAERSYTNDGNHPLEQIYSEKAITLMARRRYADALEIFRSLPDYLLDDSMRVMARYAANMTGQEFVPAAQAELASQAAVPDNVAARLAQLEANLTELGRAVVHLAQQLGEQDD